MKRIVKIKFRNTDKLYDYDANNLALKWRDKVLVDTEHGLNLGTVVVEAREIDDAEAPENLPKVIRKASADDIDREKRNQQREEEAYRFCLEKIKQMGLGMKLTHVEYFYDGSKTIFYFTADERVDFRDLVKDLAQHFHTRIEMRQIGVRDEAKRLGGIGICGRSLCCSAFLKGFEPVSVKMAKEQSPSFNPSKASGFCGRLMCCLAFEYSAYMDTKKEIPKPKQEEMPPETKD